MLRYWMLFHVMFCLYMVGVVYTPVQISCVGNTCGGGVTMVFCVATTAACLLWFTTDVHVTGIISLWSVDLVDKPSDVIDPRGGSVGSDRGRKDHQVRACGTVS